MSSLDGGGISVSNTEDYVIPVSLTVRGWIFDGNSGDEFGAIELTGLSLYITDTTFTNNSMQNGAAIIFLQYY